MEIDLPALGSVTSCPKCAAAMADGKLKTEYHEGVLRSWHNTPCGALAQKLSQGNPAMMYVANEAIGEHLCRRCTVCSYAWVEHTHDHVVEEAEEDTVPKDAQE